MAMTDPHDPHEQLHKDVEDQIAATLLTAYALRLSHLNGGVNVVRVDDNAKQWIRERARRTLWNIDERIRTGHR